MLVPELLRGLMVPIAAYRPSFLNAAETTQKPLFCGFEEPLKNLSKTTQKPLRLSLPQVHFGFNHTRLGGVVSEWFSIGF